MENLKLNTPLLGTDLTKPQVIESENTSSMEKTIESTAEIDQHSIQTGPTDQPIIFKLHKNVLEYTLEEAKQLSSREVVEVFRGEHCCGTAKLSEKSKQKIEQGTTLPNFKWEDEDKNSYTW